MNDLVIAQIRTTVPVIIASLLAWAATELGVVIDDQSSTMVTGAAVAILSAGWYAIARHLEKIPGLRWMLGVSRTPEYPVT